MLLFVLIIWLESELIIYLLVDESSSILLFCKLFLLYSFWHNLYSPYIFFIKKYSASLGILGIQYNLINNNGLYFDIIWINPQDNIEYKIYWQYFPWDLFHDVISSIIWSSNTSWV